METVRRLLIVLSPPNISHCTRPKQTRETFYTKRIRLQMWIWVRERDQLLLTRFLFHILCRLFLLLIWLVSRANETARLYVCVLPRDLVFCSTAHLCMSYLMIGHPELDILQKLKPFCEFPITSTFSLSNETIFNAVLWKLSKRQPF